MRFHGTTKQRRAGGIFYRSGANRKGYFVKTHGGFGGTVGFRRWSG
nr:MAG TPA: hypothetical protein [Caudoviricetes sp.]